MERMKGLETFVTVADAGSFTAAARRLHLTNSAVGKAVARLEARLQQPLFDRSTRRLRLTDAGAAFYKVCVGMLEDLAAAENALAAGQLLPAGVLRVDLPATYGRVRALPSLLAFVQQHPQLVPRVSFTDRFVDLVEDGMDVVVRIGGAGAWPPAVEHRLLGHEELIFCAAPSYLARHGEPTSYRQLATHTAVLYGRADGSTSPWLVAGSGTGDNQDYEARDESGSEAANEANSAANSGMTARALRHRVEGRIVLGEAEAQVAAVVAGLGVAQLATWLVAPHLRDGSLKQILPQHATRGLPLTIAWQRSRRHVPKIAALVAHFAATLAIGALDGAEKPAGTLTSK